MNTDQNPNNTCGSPASESSHNVGSGGRSKAEYHYCEARRPVWNEVLRLGVKNPEAAKEWLRMVIAQEISKDQTDVDLIAHAEEGIQIIDCITARRRGHSDLKPVEIRQADAGWSGRRADMMEADRARMANAKRNLREPSADAGAEVMALARRDPEAAKEWLRMAIRMELCRTEQEPEFIVHLEEGIELIDRLVALVNDPESPEGMTLENFEDYINP